MTSTTPTIPAAAPTQRFRVNQRDRISLILTLLVTVIALGAGLALRGAIESYTKGYKTPAGVFIEYPDTWQLSTTDDAGVIRVRDSAAQSFATTLELRTVSVEASTKDDEALSLAANQVALNRGQAESNFKLFDLSTGQTLKGLPAATSSFVFVSDTSSALQESFARRGIGQRLRSCARVAQCISLACYRAKRTMLRRRRN